jgi:hypothetical protein
MPHPRRGSTLPTAAASDWDESEHPRNPDGKFGSGGVGSPNVEIEIGVPSALTDALNADTAFKGSHGFGGVPSDTVMEAIAAYRGIDGPPTIADTDTVDAAIKSGQPEVMRAVRDPSHDDNFRSGAYYAGLGTQGNGIYGHWRASDFDPELASRAEYLGDTDLARKTDDELLASGALEDADDLRSLNRYVKRNTPKLRDRMLDQTKTYGDTVSRMTLKPGIGIADLERDVLPQQREYIVALEKRYQEEPSPDLDLWVKAMRDPGRFAAYAGIPAYYGHVPGEIVITDRTAVLVQKDRLSGPKPAQVGKKTAATPADLSNSDFRTDDAHTPQEVSAAAAARLAPAWDVTPTELEALSREDGAWDYLSTQPADQHREIMIRRVLNEWTGSSGGPLAVAVAKSVADAQSLDYTLAPIEEGPQKYIAERPAVAKATTALGEAMYAQTQAWFAERGMTEVHVYRAGRGDDWDDSRPFTSWSVSLGGTRTGDGPRSARDEIVPVERVLSVPPTGFGNVDEGEVVLLPSRPKPPAKAAARTRAARRLADFRSHTRSQLP